MSDIPATDSEQLEIHAGRRAPYTQLADWVMLAPVSKTARLLYWILAAHINVGRRKRGDTVVWPTQDDLAAMLGFSRKDKIRPFLRELEAIDAIEIEQVPVPGGGNRTKSIYTVHETPPADWAHFEHLGQFYAKRNAEKRAAKQAAQGPAEPVPAGESRDLIWGPGPGPHMGSLTRRSNKTKETRSGRHPAAPPNPRRT